jgi:hypothetical protein
MDFVFILIKNENINRHDWMDKYEHWTRLDTIIFNRVHRYLD